MLLMVSDNCWRTDRSLRGALDRRAPSIDAAALLFQAEDKTESVSASLGYTSSLDDGWPHTDDCIPPARCRSPALHGHALLQGLYLAVAKAQLVLRLLQLQGQGAGITAF